MYSQARRLKDRPRSEKHQLEEKQTVCWWFKTFHRWENHQELFRKVWHDYKVRDAVKNPNKRTPQFLFYVFQSSEGLNATLLAGKYHIVDGIKCEWNHFASKQECESNRAARDAHQTGYGGYADNGGHSTATTSSYNESLHTGYGGYGDTLDGYGGYTYDEPSHSNTSGGKAKSSMKDRKASYSP